MKNVKQAITGFLNEIGLGIRAKLSIVTGFFVIVIIVIVSVISFGQQYRSLTQGQERELMPIKTFVERLVLDMEGMSNTMLLAEDFRARVREKAAELSRYRQQETEVVTKWSDFAESVHKLMEETNKKRIEKGEITQEQAGKIKSDIDAFARQMSERSPLIKKIVMNGQETRVVYRDTYFSQYLNEEKIREIENGIRQLMVDRDGRPMPDAEFRSLQGRAADAVGSGNMLRDATARLRALEGTGAGDGPALESLRNEIIRLAARHEAAIAALNGGIQSFFIEAQKKRLLEFGLDTASIRIQLFTAGDRTPGFDTGIFSDGRGINAPAFLDEPDLRDGLRRGLKDRASAAWTYAGEKPARLKRDGRRYEVTLSPVMRNREVAGRARAVQEAFSADPGAWGVFAAEDAKTAAAFRALSETIASRLALLRQTGMRPADDREFRERYAEYALLLKKRREDAGRFLSRLGPPAGFAIREFLRIAPPADRAAERDALLHLRDAALYDYGMLRAGAGPGSYESSMRSPAARGAAAARRQAVREWIMRGESETDIPPVSVAGEKLGVFEGGVMSRSRSELE